MLEVAIIGAGPAGLGVAKEILTSCPEFCRTRIITKTSKNTDDNMINHEDCDEQNEREDEKVAIFEESDQVGGLWYRNGEKDRVNYGYLTNSFISSINNCDNKKTKNIRNDDEKNEKVSNTTFASSHHHHHHQHCNNGMNIETSSQPIYEELTANLPKDLMSFRDTPFPQNVPFMPKPKDIEEYLQNYAKKHNLLPYIYFQPVVIKCEKVQRCCQQQKQQQQSPPPQQQQQERDQGIKETWKITTRNNVTSTKKVFYAKRLLVCTGHHRKAFVPTIRGLHYFQGKMIHSSAFHSVEKTLSSFKITGCSKGNSVNTITPKILIIGGSISGADIAKILTRATTCNNNDNNNTACHVTISVRTWKTIPHSLLLRQFQKSGCIRPGISHISSDGYVHFCSETNTHIDKNTNTDTDNSTTETVMKPDMIVFATGYRYEYPYLPSSFPHQGGSNKNKDTDSSNTLVTPAPPSNKFISNDGYKMQRLYMRMLYVDDPSLVFFNIPTMALSSLMLIEYQCKWYVQYMKGILQPSQEEMELEIQSRQCDKTQDGLGIIPGFIKYCNSLALMTDDYTFWGQFVQIRLWLLVRSFLFATLSAFIWPYFGNRNGTVNSTSTCKAMNDAKKLK